MRHRFSFAKKLTNMFLQIFTEHQGHFLIRAAASVVVLAGLLLLGKLFYRRQTKTKSTMPEILNFNEQARRASRKGRSGGSGKSKRKK